MKTIFYDNNYGDAVIFSSWMLLYVTISKPDDWWKLVVYFWFNFFYRVPRIVDLFKLGNENICNQPP